MKEQRNRKKKMMKRVLLSSLCGLTIGHGVESAETSFLRRNRVEGINDSIGDSASADEATAVHGELTTMEELWERAASAAQVEFQAERALWWEKSSPDFSMSMPGRPPAGSPSGGPQPTSPPVAGPPGECLQGRSREEYIFDLLSVVTPATILEDPTTAQGLAFDYLANDDPYLVDPCVSDTIEQRYGLTTLYYALAGESWKDSTGWLGQDQECLWFGIDCLGGDPNVVTRVTLSDNNLVGSVPEEIRTLEMLEWFDLFQNAVTGSLPTTITELTRLILIDVEQNLLTGEAFPPHITNLTALQAYRASDNFLSGTISSDIKRLNQLQQLWLATNQLSGNLPTELASLTDMEILFLHENLLIGTIPSELGTLANLQDLRLNQNTIQSSIPPELFGATNLESLRLDLNFLSGTIPTNIGALTALTDLEIDTNSLSGTLPSEIANLSLLVNLIVHNNFLSGPIPNVFQGMQNLDYLDVANNLFSGTIPESIFEVPLIRLVYLSNNTLTGSIPATYSKPPLLKDLYLDGNGLVGTVPEAAAGELPELNELLLQFNFLSGSMPTSICSLRTAGTLEDLFSDCGGSSPEVDCDFPSCCNRCFEGGAIARRRQLSLSQKGRKADSLR